MPSFAGGRLTFWKLALASVGFSWCARIFFGKPRVAKPLFLRVVLGCSLQLRRAGGKSMFSFFGLFCVCIDDGVRVWVGPWRGSKFSV